jgi:hypothetical protein
MRLADNSASFSRGQICGAAGLKRPTLIQRRFWQTTIQQMNRPGPYRRQLGKTVRGSRSMARHDFKKEIGSALL